MVFFDGFAGLLFLALWIFCIIDVITSPDDRCRNLPKIAWLLIVILLADIGSIAWLVAGHTWDGQASPRVRAATRGNPAKRSAGNPDDDEEFLASLRARAEEQRRQAREAHPGSDDESV